MSASVWNYNSQGKEVSFTDKTMIVDHYNVHYKPRGGPSLEVVYSLELEDHSSVYCSKTTSSLLRPLEEIKQQILVSGNFRYFPIMNSIEGVRVKKVDGSTLSTPDIYKCYPGAIASKNRKIYHRPWFKKLEMSEDDYKKMSDRHLPKER